ncbi:MAG: alcohol dehydrogenase catalytic domain-containing protein [Hyphomicrobiales bacterium]|nr:alcohol dehydrogenase catalytic domain-containing protein [Hyphomicrobiales bacterium]
MKALIYTAPEHLEYGEFADPVARTGEEIITVDSVGVCGSDMHAFLGHDDRRPAPLILGHEAAGTTERGRRVVINPLVTCGTCRFCLSGRDNLCPDRQIISMPPREGVFAERVAMPESNLIDVPENVPLAKAALAEPVACGWHAARIGRERLHGDPDAARVLVIGGGAIGVGTAISLIAQGSKEVCLVEPNALRRDYLKSNTEMKILDSGELEDDAEFDLVIDGVGFEATRETASAKTAPGGIVVHIGLGGATGGIDVRRMTLQEITFIGSYTYTAADFRETAAAMFNGRLGALDWVEKRPLKDGQQAFLDIRNGRVAAPKIILKPQS